MFTNVIHFPHEIKAGYMLVAKETDNNRTYNLLVSYNNKDKLGCSNPQYDNWFDIEKLSAGFEYLDSTTNKPVIVIEAVYGRAPNKLMFDKDPTQRHLLWKREVKKLTVSEIEQLLGYKIEIISEEMKIPF